MKTVHFLLAFAVSGALLCACHGGDEGPVVKVEQLNDLHGPTRTLAVELREGTNMAAAPSPDGKRIAFSAQGALWIMSSRGGAAVRITDWRLEPTHPVWSPDGRTIAFQNYAAEGNFHIWTITPDGRNVTELTTGPFDEREPAWLPDGSGLVFSSDRSEDVQYKIWQVELADRSLSRLTLGTGAESNPVVSPDARRLADADAGNVFTLALGGTAAPLLVAPGTAPAWTPDGADLVYQNATRQLVVRGRVVTGGEDIFPFPVRYLPDGRFLYTAERKDPGPRCAGATPVDIGFNATLLLRRPLLARSRERGFANMAPRPAMGVSAPVISPDGKSIAFVAINNVWVMAIGQAPLRVTDDTDRDASVQWNFDGGAVYFSSDRGNAGQLAIDQVDLATRQRTRLAAVPGRSMVSPRMSPSGDRIAFASLSGQLEVWNVTTQSAEVIAPSISTQVGAPSWTRDGSRIVLVDNERINNRFREGYNKLRVIDLATREGRFFAVAPPPRQISERHEGAAVLSPDGTKVAFIMDSQLHVMPLNADASPAGAATRITSEVADLPSWAADSQTILYKSADKLKLVQASGGPAREVPFALQWTQAVPTGTTLIRAGALWNGISATLQRDVDILVTGNRITWIRPHREGSEAGATRFIDASNLTVMPGLWDSHVHPLTLYQGGQFGQIAALMLSYGLTSVQSVAGPLHQSIELREALEAGKLVGPRLFVSPPLWEGNRLFYSFARTLRTPEIADLEIAKAKTMGVDFMKSYVRAPIPIMSRIAQGALELGVQSGTHMLQPGAATGLGSTTHLSATQRMGYGWSKSFAGAITYQDAYDVYGKGDFALLDTLFSAGALAALDPAILTDQRFILVPPNGNVFTPTQILAPFRTPEALEARERALEGYAKLCATHPHTCEAGASHGH